MADSPYRSAYGALHSFISSFVAPMVAILPVLEQIKDAEEKLAALQLDLEDAVAAKGVAEAAREQAIRDRQTALDSIDRDTVAKLDDTQRHLEAVRVKAQVEIDQLHASILSADADTQRRLAEFADQIEARRQEQAALNAEIATQQQTLARLTGQVFRAAQDVPS